MSLFNWKLKKEELNNQIDNYSSLKWTKSYRKISATLIWFSVVVTMVLAIFTDLATEDMVIGVFLIYLPLSIFVYRGHRWSLWSAAIIWTIDKFYMLSQQSSGGGITQLLWWAIYMSVFMGAIQIENSRAKLNKPTQAEVETIGNTNKIKFCPKCGEKTTKQDQKFCTKCGSKM